MNSVPIAASQSDGESSIPSTTEKEERRTPTDSSVSRFVASALVEHDSRVPGAGEVSLKRGTEEDGETQKKRARVEEAASSNSAQPPSQEETPAISADSSDSHYVASTRAEQDPREHGSGDSSLERLSGTDGGSQKKPASVEEPSSNSPAQPPGRAWKEETRADSTGSATSPFVASAMLEQDSRHPGSGEASLRRRSDNGGEASSFSTAQPQQAAIRTASLPDLPGQPLQDASQYPAASNSNFLDLLRSLSSARDANRLAAAAGAVASNPGLVANTDPSARLRAELSAQLLREQVARNAASASAASLGLPPIDSLLNVALGSASHQGLSLGMQALGLPNQQALPLVLRNLAELEALRTNSSNIVQGAQSIPGFQNPLAMGGATSNLNSLLQQMGSQNAARPQPSIQDLIQGSTAAPLSHAPSSLSAPAPAPALKQTTGLPVCKEGRLEPYYARSIFPIGIDEDPNWLSEFHCFVRSELVEVFRASHEDVKARNNSVIYHQVGLRCFYCAHLIPSARAGRSSAFPSSLRQIYQSFTMMLRDHFGNCDAVPNPVKDKFLALKDKPAQGATDSKRYWIYSAMKAGLTDSQNGIVIDDNTMAAGSRAPPFGTIPSQPWTDDAFRSVQLVLPEDRSLVSEFVFVITSNVQVVGLTEAERIGNRRSLKVGLPGFGCRFCCEKRRLGLCRVFPARRRTLPSKVNDMYDHLRRCNLCPASVKENLERTKHQLSTGASADQGGDREFFDRVWNRLGHGST